MDVSDLWMGKAEESPRKEFIHYTSRGDLEGLRQDNWKLLVKKPRAPRNRRRNTQQQRPTEVMLFDLSSDVGEQKNVAEANPEVVSRLRNRMEELDAEVTSNARAPWIKK